MNEKRQAARKHAEHIVEFYSLEESLLLGVGRLLDLSATGARVESRLHMTPGQVLIVRIRRKEGAKLDLPATVVHRRGKGASTTYGLQFKRI